MPRKTATADDLLWPDEDTPRRASTDTKKATGKRPRGRPRTKPRSIADLPVAQDVAARIDASLEGEIDRAWVLDQLRVNYRLAQAALEFSAANTALRLIGTELGMFAPPKERDPVADDHIPLHERLAAYQGEAIAESDGRVVPLRRGDDAAP